MYKSASASEVNVKKQQLKNPPDCKQSLEPGKRQEQQFV